MQKRILLVDDESSLRRSISLGLSQEGYDVEPCETGLDALRKLELYKKNNMNLDTVVLDIKLPDIDGIKLGKIIRSKYPDTYLIFITGYADNYNVHEINSLNVSALMEKPFTNSELAKQILAIDKIKTAATGVVAVKEEKPVVYSAYALIKLEKDADFFETYRSLYFMNNVLYCDTTKGEYDIFMLIQSDCEEKCKQMCEKDICNMAGVKEVEILEVKRPIIEDILSDIINTADNLGGLDIEKGREMSKRVCSYILLDVEKEKFEKVYPVLRLNDQVVYCDFTSGKYNLVLFVQGSYFNEIDRFIEDKISDLDGVLKIKEFPIVNMFDM